MSYSENTVTTQDIEKNIKAFEAKMALLGMMNIDNGKYLDMLYKSVRMTNRDAIYQMAKRKLKDIPEGIKLCVDGEQCTDDEFYGQGELVLAYADGNKRKELEEWFDLNKKSALEKSLLMLVKSYYLIYRDSCIIEPCVRPYKGNDDAVMELFVAGFGDGTLMEAWLRDDFIYEEEI